VLDLIKEGIHPVQAHGAREGDRTSGTDRHYYILLHTHIVRRRISEDHSDKTLNWILDGWTKTLCQLITHGGTMLQCSDKVNPKDLICYSWNCDLFSWPGFTGWGRMSYFEAIPLRPLAHLQSIARPLGQPSVVLTIDRACDPSHQALIIFAGRYQSVQKIYLPNKTYTFTNNHTYMGKYDRVCFTSTKVDSGFRTPSKSSMNWEI
jgi:hypothetical protein